jgi:calcineurin-like phosphoesterase family protein
MALIYWTSDGGGSSGGNVARTMNQWIRANGNPSLIVYGGDVYGKGTEDEFTKFFDQLGRDVSRVCETPGNHDWKTTSTSPATGRIPSGYEKFWQETTPSKQPIDSTKLSGARYEHCMDIDGWRLVFLDTGLVDDNENMSWPFGDLSRQAWLTKVLTDLPGRSKIVFAHHSRLSTGHHNDNVGVHAIWNSLFHPVTGVPLVAFTIAGHDHNVSLYGPKSRDDVTGANVAMDTGVRLLVNGAGGDTLYTAGDGTVPDEFEVKGFCVTRINLIDAKSADVDTLSFGLNPKPTTVPKVLANFAVRFRF